MIPLIIAIGLIIFFYSIEWSLRYGKEARSFKTTEKDNNSTFYLKRLISLNTVIIPSAFLLNHYDICVLFNDPLLAISGNVIMVTGLLLRVFAVLTLKEYYTRTLKIQENQKIIDVGLYKHLRHPGYLGLIMIWTGAGLSSNNYLILIIVALLTLSAYHYRMNSEEKMLIEAFGDDYKNYMQRTWRIAPLIY